MALTTDEILDRLNESEDGYYGHFITLNHPYVYLIDSRLNIFSDCKDHWAVIGEVLGYNPRGEGISLQLFYFGNCLTPMQASDGWGTNSCHAWPIELDSQMEATDGDEVLLPEVNSLLIRGKEIPLSHEKQDYADAGIELKEYEPGEISMEEAGRLLITRYQDMLRATDEELYQHLPAGLPKILVIDEWFHKEFGLSLPSPLEDKQFFDRFVNGDPEREKIAENDIKRTRAWNEKQWADRPSTYETWQQIAEVIVTCDPSKYKPTLKPNSHWRNWPESGSL